MDLIIDIGNYKTKIAVFKDDELVELTAIEDAPIDHIQQFILKHKPENAILSSVVVDDEGIVRLLKQNTRFTLLKADTALPIKNNYSTPRTLGTDRLAAVNGAFKLFRNRNVLIINGGTCVTFDLLTAEGVYLGGAISPGLTMRFSALNTFTDKLPLINFENDFNHLIGTSTRESILSGVQNGLIAELEGIISRYEKQFENLAVVLCGGDSNFFDSRLKNSIFAPVVNWQPNLVLIGLNAILKYQYA
ncbi:type III pantothenate kinase [Solitalea sp. MAHUQ-68]|uniref:Type III pantothenate kinase n=1 Tax=Solitalea agri TaxID=2953739 RepID=A0A9X2JF68_9SPHI|nr:type III pantothenate kinase [Solitalea agri]MCO4293096.1 type III pantothenate kinase [Solitalea agri]